MIDVDIYPEDRLTSRYVGRDAIEPLKTRLPWIPPVGGDIAITYAEDGEEDAIICTTCRVYPHTNEAAVQISVETRHLGDDVVKMLFGRDERGGSR
jgi:hypothetical protein